MCDLIGETSRKSVMAAGYIVHQKLIAIFGVGETPEDARENARAWLQIFKTLAVTPASQALIDLVKIKEGHTRFASRGGVLCTRAEAELLE